MTLLPWNGLAPFAQQEMTDAFLEVFPDAPTLNLVDPKVGPTWGDLQSLPAWLQSRQAGTTMVINVPPALARPPEGGLDDVD